MASLCGKGLIGGCLEHTFKHDYTDGLFRIRK